MKIIFKKFNKEKFKGIIIGSIVTSVVTTSLFSFAGGILKQIEVAENSVKLKVNGVDSSANTYIIDGRTYVQTRSICDLLGKDLSWDASTSTVEIKDKGTVSTNTLPTKDIEDATKVNGKVEVSPSPTPTVIPIPTVTTTPNTSSDFVFRKIKWGMTKEEVIKSEGKAPDSDEGNYFLYKLTINSRKTHVIYNTNNQNQLCSALVVVDETHTNENDYIADYESFKKIFNEKYGKPQYENDMVWKGDLYKGDVKNYGMAVCVGDLTYLQEWETQDTTISEILRGDNYKSEMAIRYQSKNIVADKQDKGL